MNKTFQTSKVVSDLYDLTQSFTSKYQPMYYKQFRGDTEDLASEIFCQFMTPKAKAGEKKTLLDRYDMSKCPVGVTQETYFANFVKVAVQRKLIDCSRLNPISRSIVSMDVLMERSGESFLKEICPEFLDNDEELDMEALYKTLTKKFARLSYGKVMSVKSYYAEVRNVLPEQFQSLFDKVLNPVIYVETSIGNLPCYEVVGKTARLLYKNRVVDFDRSTGLPRRPYPIQITPKGLSVFTKFKAYKYADTKDVFSNRSNVASYRSETK